MAGKQALAAEAQQFQKRTRLFFWAATAVFAALAFFLALQIFVHLRDDRDTTRNALIIALSWAPAIFYLWAVWSVRGLFAALSRKGFVFHDVIAGALGRIGLALLLGALTSLAALPFLIQLGSRILGQFAIFAAPALTIGVIGLGLIAVAGMIRRAARLELKAASLQAKLDEFF